MQGGEREEPWHGSGTDLGGEMGRATLGGNSEAIFGRTLS